MPLLDPVIVTVYAPAEPEQDRVELPFVTVVLNAMLVGDRLHVKPEGGETEFERATVPENPFRPLTVIVDVAPDPARTLTIAGDGRILKS